MKNLDAFECYDYLLVEPLLDYGWDVDEVPWRKRSVDWNQYDVVIIRSPWDYQDDPKQFMGVLETIDQSSARLENSLDIVRWNLDKRYLKDMQAAGIPIVPTQWRPHLKGENISSFFEIFDTDEIIIKPVVSANADHTYRVKRTFVAQTQRKLQQVFAKRPLMVQPFMKNIIGEGEFSLFYFAGSYSHTILKTPQTGDFRVQEEHGGQLKTVNPDADLLRMGDKTMKSLPETPLYARVDFVRTAGNNFALMELELIEPSLYFNMDAESPRRFAREFDRWIKEKN